MDLGMLIGPIIQAFIQELMRVVFENLWPMAEAAMQNGAV